jgi:hypothetical protein
VVGCSVAVGLAAADDGGAAVVEVELAAVVGVALGPAVVVGAAELLVGAGTSGPKQPVSTIRAASQRTLNAENPCLAMMPLLVRSP